MNIEARKLINDLKAKVRGMEDNLASFADPKSDEAVALEEQIKELKTVIKFFETITTKLDNTVPKNDAEIHEIEDLWKEIVGQLREYNDSGLLKTKLSDTKVSELEELIEELSDVSNLNEEKTNKEEEKKEQVVSTQPVQNSSPQPLRNVDKAYMGIFSDREKKINEKIAKLKQRELHDITGHTTTLIMGYQIELKELAKQKQDYLNRETLDPETEERLSALESKHDDIAARQAELRAKISELQALRSQLVGARGKRKIDKKVEKFQKEINRLNIKDVKLIKQQKSIMYPKYKADLKRQSLLSTAAGRVQNYEEKQAVNDELMSMLDENSIIDNIKKSIYEIKGAHYCKKIERSRAILEEMQKSSSIIRMRGARLRVMSNSYADRIRENNEKQAATLNAPEMSV